MQALLQRLERGESLYDPPADVRFPHQAGREANGPAPVPAGTAAVDGWAAAKAEFNRALRHAERLRAARVTAARALRDVERLGMDVVCAQTAERRARQDEEQAAEAVESAYAALREASAAYQDVRAGAGSHAQGRPGGLRSMLGTGHAFAEWQERERWFQAEVERTYLACGAARNHALAAERALDECVEIRRHALERLRLARDAADLARRVLEQARADWGERVPEDWEQLDDTRRELSAPWSDEEFCAARTRVFHAALNLHRAFIVANARTLRLDLLLLKEVFAGVAPQDAALAVCSRSRSSKSQRLTYISILAACARR
ncbi:hypothetical protein [Streptomyces caeruleatus]|uniref:Uncharacterized protein n=1 Tax=Streptomyces caeruleatus TaxID=661399 RepID=A0A124I9Y0_9ACTN|nr:hypothetical protein [Streptomyces caeruleatus]KUO03962.1 hypothetical protein AQJ67_14505 [Streptomyces caeruleatus]